MSSWIIKLFIFCRLLSGQERHEISYAMLVFDATKEVGYKGPGAHHAEIRKEPPRGLALYPIAFSHPWEDPEELKPSLISAITEWNLDLKTCNKVVYSYDQRVCNGLLMNTNYCILHISVNRLLLIEIWSFSCSTYVKVCTFMINVHSKEIFTLCESKWF